MMMLPNIKNYGRQFLAVTFSLILTSLAGCGYHLRSEHQWPAALSSLDFQSNSLPSDVQSSLTQFLKSMHVRLTKDAPYQLVVSNYVYSQTQPSSINSTIPSTISFSISMTLSILSKSGKTCIPAFGVSSQFSELAAQSVLVTRSVDPDIKARLLENMNQSIYSSLTSDDSLSQLNSPHCQGLDQKIIRH
jgi:hypothetical protein